MFGTYAIHICMQINKKFPVLNLLTMKQKFALGGHATLHVYKQARVYSFSYITTKVIHSLNVRSYLAELYCQ